MIAAVFFSANCYSQPVIGFKSGYSLRANAPVCNIQAGARLGNSHVYYNQVIHLTRKANVNQIVGLRYGYNIASFQPYIGYDFHLSTNHIMERNNLNMLIENPNKAGFYFAFGITKYFEKKPVMISIDKSGKYITIGVGFYKVLY